MPEVQRFEYLNCHFLNICVKSKKNKKPSCKKETDSISKATGILLWGSAVSEYGKTVEGKSETDTVSGSPEFYFKACSNSQY